MTYALDKKVNMGEYPGYMKVNYLGPAAVVEARRGCFTRPAQPVCYCGGGEGAAS